MTELRETPRSDGLRALTFVGSLSLAWVTARPFVDLGASDALDLATGREAISYVAFGLCALCCAALVFRQDRPAFAPLRRPAYLGIGVCLGLSVLLSQDLASSLKRAMLCLFAVIVAAALPLLPRDRRQFVRFIAVCAAIVLGLSYFGVLFLPDLAIHQSSDLLEPELAGDWRGVFGHKNAAAAVFAFVLFAGIYVLRAGDMAAGALIALLSFVFLVFAHGKTANMMAPPAILISLLVTRYGAAWAWRVLALSPFLALTAFGVGSVIFSPLQGLGSSLLRDATFTGRTDIWRFALSKIWQHPLFGFGFGAFWNTPEVRYGTDASAAWVAVAQHAHNSYVDVALTMGLPALALTIWAFVFQPLADIGRAVQAHSDPALVMLMTQIWLFGLYLSTLESFFFDRADPIWFTFLFAVFALRYLSTFRIAST